MVGAGSLPAWAVLAIEAARLAVENGWLGTRPKLEPHAEALEPYCPACAECPACSPVLRCPEAVWWPSAAALTVAASLGAAVVCFCRSDCCRHGRPAARTAPARRGGGMVA
jgi:hypothetical protein